MKILVLSDSHGVLRYMERAVQQENPNFILHLGDCERDAQMLQNRFPQIPVSGVPGNCDFPGMGDNPNRVLEFGGVRVYLTHGHTHGVKQSLLRLELAAREAEAQIVVFGHTHSACCTCKDGLWLLNPGTSMGRTPPTYGVILVENGNFVCYTNTHKCQQGEEIPCF